MRVGEFFAKVISDFGVRGTERKAAEMSKAERRFVTVSVGDAVDACVGFKEFEDGESGVVGALAEVQAQVEVGLHGLLQSGMEGSWQASRSAAVMRESS